MRQYQIRTFDAGSVIFGCTQAGFVRLFRVEITVAFHISIHDDGDGMVTDHRTGIVGSQIPHRVYSAFLMFLYQRVDELIVQIGVDDCH